MFSLLNIRFASVYATRGANRIGRVYKKAIFRQYTDDTYTQEIPKAAWLGFLGPVLKAEEEDVFIIHLKNFASRPYSVHPHGVFYDKDSEGKSCMLCGQLVMADTKNKCALIGIISG
uniref:Plastocyanin-like domain-containing protein n=1 Tax=Coturnix japonica TaxID=93934 RepID=A0A8C2Y6E7_COTJA